MSAQFDAVSALRKRAMNAAGWDAAWPVAYAAQPFTPPAVRQFIEEAIVGGPGVPVAMTPPSFVFYRYTGQWQLLFIAPPAFGSFATLAMAEGVVQEVMRAGLALPDGTPILIRALDIGQDVTVEGDVQRALVITYEYTLAVSMAPLVPTTPTALRTLLHSQRSVDDPGATVVWHGVPGYFQTVLPNGHASLADPTLNSATGYWCTFWDDAVSPGLGKHLRPQPGVNNGNGEPCIPFDTTDLTKGAHSGGVGLYHPASLGYDGSGADFHTDAAIPANPADPTTWITDSGGLDNVRKDLSAGVSYGGVAKQRSDSYHVRVGPANVAGTVDVITDTIYSWQAMSDPITGLAPASILDGQGTAPMHWSYYALDTLAGIPYGVYRFDRCLIKDDFRQVGTTVQTAGRDVVWGGNGGRPFNADCSHYERYILAGTFNAAQTKTYTDWAEAQYPGLYQDARTRGLILWGDSFDSPLQSKDEAAPLVEGARNIPRIPSAWFTAFARSGNDVHDQFRFLAMVRAMDLSRITVLGNIVGEFINDVAGHTVLQQLQRNYFWIDRLREIDPKIRIVMNDVAWCNTTSRATNDPGIRADLLLHAVQDHGCVGIESRLLTQFNDTYYYGGGTGLTQPPILYNGNDTHPGQEGQEYWTAMRQIGLLRALGDDVSTRTYKVDPVDDVFDLTIGATASTAWTRKDFNGAPLAGGTLTFGTFKIIANAVTPDTSVATVDPVTGLITAVGAGQCFVRALAADGGQGVCTINVSGTAQDGSIADVVNTLQAAGLTVDYVGDPSVAGTTASLPDARGGAFATSLDTSAGAPTLAGGVLTLTGGAKMQSALLTALDMSVGERGLVLIGTDEGDNVFLVAGYDNGSGQWGIGASGGKWALGTTFSGALASVLAGVGVTPRLAITEHVKDVATSLDEIGFRAYGELAQYTAGAPPAGNARLFIGGSGTITVRGVLSYSGGRLDLSSRQALARWATARGVSVTAVDSTKALLVVGNDDTRGAGTTTPATDAWPIKLAAELPIAYTRRTYNLGNSSFPQIDAAVNAMVKPWVDPALRTTYWVLIEPSLFDQFSSITTAQAIASLHDLCDVLQAIGANVRVGVATICDNSTATESGNAWYATVNAEIRALVAEGRADCVLDMQAHGWNAGTNGDGQYFNTATSQAIADAWFALMSGVGV